MIRTLVCVVIGLSFLAATAASAAVTIDGRCQDDCLGKGDTYGECRKKCSDNPKPSDSSAPADNISAPAPKFHLECAMKCQNNGNTRDFCKSICTY
jgi:hypothetical protein